MTNEHEGRSAFNDDRGGFDEREARVEVDREMPSVARGGASVGGLRQIALYGAVIIAAAGAILLTVDFGGEEDVSLTAPRIVDDRSVPRETAPAFPGLGFELDEPEPEIAPQAEIPPPGETAEERALRLARERQRLEAERARLEAQLEAERAARELQLEAARMQIEAARQAEEERVKRLRSDVLIIDASGEEEEAGPRDLPPEPDAEAAVAAPEGGAGSDGAAVDEETRARLAAEAEAAAAAAAAAGDGGASPFPPALLEAIAEGQKPGDGE